MKKNPLRQVWRDMKRRCYNPKDKRYYCYGARGIEVCSEWFNYDIFKIWALANGWQQGLQIDRRENDGNYEPSNCRIVTRKANLNNTRSNRFITHEGETLTIAQWAERMNIPYSDIYYRIKNGWDPSKAVSTQIQSKGAYGYKPIICINTGKQYESISAAARDLNLWCANVSNVIRKKAKATGGYMFELAVQ